jgi:predicted nucleotidyltransferase
MIPELRKLTHEERLSIGRQISTRVLDKYGDSVLLVYICGSTAKNLDRPYSDLEMIVVVQDGVTVASKYYVHRGLVIEVDYRQESEFVKAARAFTKNWPMEADQYRNRIVLFEREQWTRRLDQAIVENEKADASEALRVAAVELTEDSLRPTKRTHHQGPNRNKNSRIRHRGRSLNASIPVKQSIRNND